MSWLSKESALCSVASTSQEDPEEDSSASASIRTLNVTLLSSEWKSTKGGVSTISRELAIQLAKHPNVEVSVYLPKCSEEDKKNAASLNVKLIEAEELPGLEPLLWLGSVPEYHAMDCVIGHGVQLGRQIPLIKRQNCHCKWIQIVHTAPEDLGMYKSYEEAISKGEQKHQGEVKLCEMADQVVAVGPKLADAFACYLRPSKKDQDVLTLTPSIFNEFLGVEQATEERRMFCVLVFGRGDSEDFKLKGYDIAVQAVAELKDTSYQLMFVGAPVGKEDEVADRLLQHGIPPSQLTVRRFKESRDELAKLFCEVDLAIMPSRTEGFGLTALEALSCGLPVLVGGNSGLGVALKKVVYGSQCVVDSEDPKEWAKKIKAVREKSREVRLAESKLLRDKYMEKFRWQESCGLLLEKMQNLVFGSSERKGKKDKRPLPLFDNQPSKRPRGELTDHEGSSKRETSAKVRRSSSSVQVTKQPRLLTGIHKGSARMPAQPSKHGKRSSPGGTRVPNQKRLLTRADKGSSERGTLATSPNQHRLSTDSDTGHGLPLFLRILKAEYDRRSLLKPLLWENTFKLPLEEVYTRLSIVSRRKTDFKLESGEVNLYDVFKFLNKGEDGMVLVEGSPGIGKTTFCLKISHDWTNEKIPNDSSFPVFKLLLLLKCRDIHGDIMEAISEQLLPEDTDEKITKELMDYIKDIHNQEKILIILDGLDELPKRAESHVEKLLFRRVLPFCYILCTSRQETGIVVRQKFDFDILFQIEGFREQDAFEYIRKHFSLSDSYNLSKGEQLIEAIQENTFLHALLNNPLNLLLLCVVFEDYKGELPSFRTELYQIIVRCLLRRYCAKHKLEAPCDDQALEKKFEKSLLVLGELAWRCLQEDRFCFREEELAKFESENEDLVARELGLVFKEASMKKINPQHEYHFFHKTFQEYLAATYLVHKLLKEEANVFCEFGSDFQENVTDKYRQVFLFVSGILRKDASVLFKQIGETLNASEHWDWLKCREQEATFFCESFNESRNAEEMAMTLCSFIPFPRTVEINLPDTNTNILMVAEECSNFPQLQHPVHLTVNIPEPPEELTYDDDDLEVVAKFLESCPKLETFSCCIFHLSLTTSVPALFEGLSKNSTISSFTFRAESGIFLHLAANIGNSLAAIKTLRTVTFELVNECDEAWAVALERGLSTDTPLSVVLKIYGSLIGEAVGALKKVLSNRSLSSLALIIYGEMQDSLATAVGKTLATESILKSLTLIVYGKISNFGAISLERGFLENSALNSLEVKVFGELPVNWVTVVEKVLEAKKSKMSVAFHPIITGTISETQVTRLCPDFELQSLTLNLLGELSFTGADTLCKLLMKSSTPCVTLNIHGKVTSSVAERLVSYLKPCKTLSSLRMNIWGELSRSGNSSLQELKCSVKYSFALKVCSVASDPWICKDVNYTIDVPSPLISVLTKVELNCASFNISDHKILSLDCPQDLEDVMATNRSLSLTFHNTSDLFGDWTLRLGDDLAKNTFHNNIDLRGDWMRGLGDGLAKSTSLTTLSLTFHNNSDLCEDWMCGLGDGLAKNTFHNHSDLSGDWACGLGDGLAKNTSLTTPSLTFNNYSDLSGDWMRGLGDGLAKNTSLTTLSLTFNNCSDLSGDWMRGLGDGFAKNTSLTTLSLTFHNNSDLSGDWMRGLGDGFAKNTSLTTLNLTFHNNSDLSGDWMRGLGDGLAKNTSLTTLHVSLAFNNYSDPSEDWMHGLGDGLAKNTSLTTLHLTTFNNNSDLSGDWMRGLDDGLAKNTSLTTLHLSLTFNNNSDLSGDCMRGLGDGLAKNTSLTTQSLTFNNHSDLSEDWMRGLGDGLAKNTSLTTLSLTFNHYIYPSEHWMRGLGDGLAKNTSLTTLSLTFNNYIDVSEDWMRGLGDGLAKNTSLTTLSLTFNNHSDLSEDWMCGLGDGLAKNTSLTTLSLTFNNYSDLSVDWARGLGNGLAKNSSLTTLSLTFKNDSDLSEDWTRGLGDGLAKNTSLTTLHVSITFNNYSVLSGDWMYGVGDGLAKNTSLTTLCVTINSYSCLIKNWTHELGDGLAQNTSLTTLSLAFNNYSDLSGDWTRGLGYGLAKNTSLTTLSLTFNNYSDLSGNWAYDLGDGLAKNTSLIVVNITVNSTYLKVSEEWLNCICNSLAESNTITSLSFTFNDHSGTSEVLGLLKKHFADCNSSPSLNLTVSLYGEAAVS